MLRGGNALLVCAVAAEDDEDGAHEDSQVEANAPVAGVVGVEPGALQVADVVASRHLS